MAVASGDGPALPILIIVSGFSPTDTRVPTVPESPSFSAVTLYSPGKRPIWTNSPFLLVLTSRVFFMPLAVIVTLAPSTGASFTSTTLPLSMPVCAETPDASASTKRAEVTIVTQCPSRFRSMGVALHRIVMTRNDARTLVVYYRPLPAAHGRPPFLEDHR